MADEALVESARAKLNLDLLVTGRRADGYHELDSLVVFVPIADRLTFEHAPGLSLEVTGPFAAALGAADDNLVLRAARALADAAGREPAFAIRLEKLLPVASGIGGGSADAAATLRGLARLLGLDWPADRLRELGLDLGADVPVCLWGRPARLRGIGERLDPVRGLPGLPLVLANPGIGLGTAEVFRALDPERQPVARPPFPPHPSLTRFAVWLHESRNELEPAARRLAPVIGYVLERLRREPDCLVARMSGSGATCFGLFADEESAEAAAARIAREEPGWWCRAATAPGGP
ncbi:MAG TPA: 4-(cytidine 5'-diphospho)-2-C-methyl-D-erythritol kinase [Geminicoccaceae bacterium]|nr:4-(cytidine 5'-diphospho)-2-C-methyl-D-erythritol kinase [Geminicoccaceae bacterium]